MRIVAIDLPKGIIRHQYQSTNQWACVTCLGSHCQFVPIRWPSPEVFDEQIGSLSQHWRARRLAERQWRFRGFLLFVCLFCTEKSCIFILLSKGSSYGLNVFLVIFNSPYHRIKHIGSHGETILK